MSFLVFPTACGEPNTGSYASSCNVAPHPIKAPEDGIAHLVPVFLLELNASQELRFRGEQVSLEQVEKIIGKFDQLLPQPYLVLEVDPSTPCDRVHQVRKVLVESDYCQRGCAEGADWQEWPFIR